VETGPSPLGTGSPVARGRTRPTLPLLFLFLFLFLFLPLPLRAESTLTPRALENLETTARLFSLVKWFHPSDAGDTLDWHGFAVACVERVEPLESDEELARTLQDLFSPVAPSVSVFAGTSAPRGTELVFPGGQDLSLVYLVHKGGGGRDASWPLLGTGKITVPLSTAGGPLTTPVVEIPALPNLSHRAALGGSLSCLVPLSLYKDRNGTLPRPPVEATPETREVRTGNDRATRLAAVLVLDGFLRYLRPLPTDPAPDADGILRNLLREAASDVDALVFLGSLRRALASTGDGQIDVRWPGGPPEMAMPFALRWIEDEVVVTAVDESLARDLQPGDVVTEIDGREAKIVIDEKTEEVPLSTPGWQRLRALDLLALGPGTDFVRLVVRRVNGKTESLTVHRSLGIPRWYELQRARRPVPVEIEPGIFVVDLEGTPEEVIDAMRPRLVGARGIVFDVRGVTRIVDSVLGRLTAVPLSSPFIELPVITRPGGKESQGERSSWTIAPRKPRLPARVVFLADARSAGATEILLSIVADSSLGEIVGSQTAGACGERRTFELPGGYEVSFTAARILSRSGDPIQGRGIAPTHRVSPTIRGIIAEKDELLEKALEILRASIGQN